MRYIWIAGDPRLTRRQLARWAAVKIGAQLIDEDDLVSDVSHLRWKEVLPDAHDRHRAMVNRAVASGLATVLCSYSFLAFPGCAAVCLCPDLDSARVVVDSHEDQCSVTLAAADDFTPELGARLARCMASVGCWKDITQ